LGFLVERRGIEGWRVTPPSFRLDVTREVDLIEEVARHYGYDRLPARLRHAPPRLERDATREKELAVSNLLVRLGYREIITSSMVDPAENARFAEQPPVTLANPLSQDASALRSSAIPSMLRALRWNLDRDLLDLRFFEVGKTYTMQAEGKPEETRVLTLGLTGHRRPPSPHDFARELDFFDLKGDLETLLAAFEVPEMKFQPSGCRYYDGSFAGRFTSGDRMLALFGRLETELEREYKLRQAAWLAEVDFGLLLELPLREPTFVPFSKFPSVERDLSLVVPEEVTYARLESALRGLVLAEMQGFRPVDLADRSKVATLPPGHYGLLLRLMFQSHTHTLTGEEINEASRRVLAALEPLGVRLRS
jgi:phenylalanyl-tRNA synthetase beta chain